MKTRDENKSPAWTVEDFQLTDEEMVENPYIQEAALLWESSRDSGEADRHEK